MLPKDVLLIRADASGMIGAGHVMRCLSLAQEWKARGGSVYYLSKDLTDPIQARLATEGCEVLNIPAGFAELEILLRSGRVAALVIDVYQFDDSELAPFSSLPPESILVVDDNSTAASYTCGFLLNQNGHATPSMYNSKVPPLAELLLGPSFALLRREYQAYLDFQRDTNPAPSQLLITLGGGNQGPLLEKLLVALDQPEIRRLTWNVVIPNEGCWTPRCRDLADDQPVVLQVAPKDFSKLMHDCDVLVSSGGATVWEALYMQIPSVFVAIAENQVASLSALSEKSDFPVFLGPEQFKPASLQRILHENSFRQLLASQGRNLVDGRGTSRILDHLENPRHNQSPFKP